MEQQRHGVVGQPARRLVYEFNRQVSAPPRRDTRAQVFAAVFGFLLVTSVAVPAFSKVETLIFIGILAAGFAELLDPQLRRFVVALRLLGPVIALSGLTGLLL